MLYPLFTCSCLFRSVGRLPPSLYIVLDVTHVLDVSESHPGCVLCEVRATELNTKNVINPVEADLSTVADETGVSFTLRI